tara:strand:+ start:318 stop:749 length:432 start_codon:yes stop_codon:yes gene_type:complete
MNNKKFLKIAVVLLLILNVCTISIIVLHGSKREGPKDEIIKKLKFDSEQIEIYELLIVKHRLAIKNNKEQNKETKGKLYNLLKGEDYSPKISLITNLEKINTEIEHLNFNHFIDIKEICKPDQIDEFNKLTEELSEIFEKSRK